MVGSRLIKTLPHRWWEFYKVRRVLGGTSPHIIRPCRARALRFEVEGLVVFSVFG